MEDVLPNACITICSPINVSGSGGRVASERSRGDVFIVRVPERHGKFGPGLYTTCCKHARQLRRTSRGFCQLYG